MTFADKYTIGTVLFVYIAVTELSVGGALPEGVSVEPCLTLKQVDTKVN